VVGGHLGGAVIDHPVETRQWSGENGVRIVPLCSVDEHTLVLDLDFISRKSDKTLDKQRGTWAFASEHNNITPVNMVPAVPKPIHQDALSWKNGGRHASGWHDKGIADERPNEMGHSVVAQAKEHKEKHVAPPPLVAFLGWETIPLGEQERIDSEIDRDRHNAQTKQDEAETSNRQADCGECENGKDAGSDKPKKEASSQSANINLPQRPAG
jgi:hypothetical protein